MQSNTVIVRSLGLQAYLPVWEAMKHFTQERTQESIDEIWVLEHLPVFTQGQNGKAEHLLNPGDIPVIQIDRGGQVTYHGPGQLVIYTLIDIQRKKINLRELVTLLEQSVIALLKDYKIPAFAKREAPGIYVNDQKIGSIGLRIKRGCAYHGLAFNVQMDLTPFSRINPCGFSNLSMTQLSDLAQGVSLSTVSAQLIEHLLPLLGYTHPIYTMGMNHER